MDLNTLNGILRAVIPAILAFAVGKGWISQGTVGDITAAIVTLVAAAWSVKSNITKGNS